MKASAWFGAGWDHDSVEVLWQDSGRAFCRLGRDGPAGDVHAFIPVLSDSEHSTVESINHLIREYELKDSLAADWALRPVEAVLFAPMGVTVHTAVSAFPDELYQAPRNWVERAYPKLIHYNKVAKGGHFAAWEQPQLFSEEVRAGFRSLRS